MGTPTDKEFQQALSKATEMRAQRNDPDFISKSLLSLNDRVASYERVINAAKLYLHSGQNTTEHARLVRALQEFDNLEQSSSDDTPFGLD